MGIEMAAKLTLEISRRVYFNKHKCFSRGELKQYGASEGERGACCERIALPSGEFPESLWLIECSYKRASVGVRTWRERHTLHLNRLMALREWGGRRQNMPRKHALLNGRTPHFSHRLPNHAYPSRNVTEVDLSLNLTNRFLGTYLSKSSYTYLLTFILPLHCQIVSVFDDQCCRYVGWWYAGWVVN